MIYQQATTVQLSYNDTDGRLDSHTDINLGSKIALGLGLSSCCAVIILGNSLVITAIGINRKLRTVTNYYVLSLALADCTLGVFVLPFSLILQLEKRWFFGRAFCKIWAAADVLCCTASILSLCAISVDRYIGVTKPLKHRNMSKKKAWLFIVGIWVVSLVISIVGPVLQSAANATAPVHIDDCTVIKSEVYVVASVTCSFYIPALVIIIIYLLIYKEAKKQYRFLRTGIKHVKGGERNTSSPLLLRAHSTRLSKPPVKTVVRNGVNGPDTCQENVPSSIDSDDRKFCETQNPQKKNGMKKTPSNSQLNGTTKIKLRRLTVKDSLSARLADFNSETRAAKTLGIVVGVFLLLWFPFFLILPIDAICKNIPQPLFDFVFWLGYCNSMFNPMIYAMRMAEFKKTFLQILCCNYQSQRRKSATTATFNKQRYLESSNRRLADRCSGTGGKYPKRDITIPKNMDTRLEQFSTETEAVDV